MGTCCRLLILTALVMGLPFAPAAAPRPGQHPRATLIEARNLAYDANFRNDQAGLRSAIASLEPLARAGELAAYADYYISWSYWALSGAQMQAKDTAGALESGKLAVRHARRGLAVRAQDPEFQAALVNALIVVMILDRAQFEALYDEVKALRTSVLALGPKNPRVAIMDAGMIFNNPSEQNGPERGLARWEEALKLFEMEAAEVTIDPIAPRWGQALAHGWIAGLYLRMTPPRKDQARAAADAALRMRPDFWWVRDQILPQLRD